VAADHELITLTVQEYFEGWCDADAARTGRVLHRDLVKRSRADDDGAVLTEDPVLQACAGGGGTRAADRRVTTGIADVCGDIASAVVSSGPCREYLHLVRTGDGRKIANALWLPQ